MKTLSDKMILSSSPEVIKFVDKKGNMLKFSGRKCGQKMYLEKDVKMSINDLKEFLNNSFDFPDDRFLQIAFKNFFGVRLIKRKGKKK